VTALPVPESFLPRHIGPSDADVKAMLATLGYSSLDALIDATVPANIRLNRALALPAPMSEQDALAAFRRMVSPNEVWRSFIGLGYSTTHTPAVVQRNILENPGWYTAYTPYQAEISQGRLEALLNFQTMVADLTALPLANASLLDEGTAAAEAMHMAVASHDHKRTVFWADAAAHPQSLAVMRTRAAPLGIDLRAGHIAPAIACQRHQRG